MGEVSASPCFKKINNMESKEIERLIEKKKLTREEKAMVKAEADRLGIAYTLKQGCGSCWEKLLLNLYDAHRVDVKAAVSLDGYRMKNPKHAFQTYNGEVFSNDTIAGKVVGKLHPNILKEYFVKVEAETEAEAEAETEAEAESEAEAEAETETETETASDADNSEI